MVPKPDIKPINTLNEWLTRSPVAAYLAILIVVAVSLFRLEGQVDVNREQADEIEEQQLILQEQQQALQDTQVLIDEQRDNRVRLQSEINRFICHENNSQDATLKQLLRGVSMARSTGQMPGVTKAFKRAIRTLTPPSDCNLLAKGYRHAASKKDFGAVLDVLRRNYRVP